MFRTPATQRVLAAAIAACFGSVAVAQPVGMTPLHGSATLQQDGARTTVTTINGAGTRHSAIDWRGFSVPVDRSVYFAQPDAASTSINRVTGGDPSSIFGTLGSNGRLVLVNPAGIAVGAGAVVDTAGFTASTLPMSKADAIAGQLRFGSGDTGANPAKLSVEGEVLAKNGDVVLIGPKVETGQAAVVRSNGGDVILAAGRKVYLTGRGLEGIRFEVRAPDDRALNLGRLQGDSVAIFASLLQHSGTITAGGTREGSGKVVLQATQQAEVAGAIQASAPAQGGSVHLTAERLVLKAATAIDVSHRNGGGEILVGGGWQGGDARIANAFSVDVEQGVQLKADATLAGNGGTVVVWSDDSTRFGGTLTALGAGPNGAGGRAEVSGRRELVFRGKADLGAASGRSGTLLLDPDTVTIRGGSGSSSDATFFESDLEAMNANIAIQANRRIEAKGTFSGNELLIAPDRNLKLEVVGGGSGGILLQGMAIRTQGTGTVELRTVGKDQDILPGRITTAGGAITLAAKQSDVKLAAPLDSAGGAVAFAGKKLEMNAVQVFAPGTMVTADVNGIEQKGTLVLGEGATFATGGADFANKKDAVVAGSGRFDLGGGKFVNEGVLRPGGAGAVGDLSILGDLEIRKDARLEIDVAGPTHYDRLVVNGKAKLDGKIDLTPLAYAPAATDSYALVEGASVGGTFDKFGKDGSDATGFNGFKLVYQPARVLFVGPQGSLTPAPVTPPATVTASAGAAGGGGSGAQLPAAVPAPATIPAPAPAPAPQPVQEPTPVPAPAPSGVSAAPEEPTPAAVVQPKFVDTATMGNAPAAPQELAPLQVQPVAVQAAVQQPAASTDAYLARAPEAARPAESEEAAAAKRRVRVTAVQCRVE